MHSDEPDYDKEFERLISQLDEVAPEPQRRTVGLILVPTTNYSALDLLVKSLKLPGQLVRLDSLVGIWIEPKDQPTPTDWDIQLLGEDRPLPAEVEETAKALCGHVDMSVVALASFITEGDDSDQSTGTLIARRFCTQETPRDLPAGLILSGIDENAELLLLGRVRPEDLPKKRKWFRHGED